MNLIIVLLIVFVLFLFFFITGYACYKSIRKEETISNINLFGNLLNHNDTDEGKEYSLI